MTGLSKLVFGLVLFIASQIVQAQSLGQIRIPVPDRDQETRNQAIEQGLERVLVRLTGQVSPRELPGAGGLFSSPSRWLQQFGYESGEADSPSLPADPESGEDSPGGSGLELAMLFDISALISAMESAGLPVWVTHRPPVLVWMVVQRPGFGEILGADSDDGVLTGVLERASARGLPVVVPAMNSADQARISPADIRGRFDQVLDEASAPYGTRFRVAAVLYAGATPQLRWRLLDGTSEVAAGELSGTDEAALAVTLADTVSDYFVSRYTVRAGTGVERMLRVRGVNALQDWHRLLDYVSGLAGMKQARMARVAAQEVEFALVFSGPDDQLLRLLEVNRRLRVCADPGAASAPAVPEPAPVPGTADVAAALPEASARPPLPDYCWQP